MEVKVARRPTTVSPIANGALIPFLRATLLRPDETTEVVPLNLTPDLSPLQALLNSGA